MFQHFSKAFNWELWKNDWLTTFWRPFVDIRSFLHGCFNQLNLLHQNFFCLRFFIFISPKVSNSPSLKKMFGSDLLKLANRTQASVRNLFFFNILRFVKMPKWSKNRLFGYFWNLIKVYLSNLLSKAWVLIYFQVQFTFFVERKANSTNKQRKRKSRKKLDWLLVSKVEITVRSVYKNKNFTY